MSQSHSWRLAAWCAAACAILLLAATSTGLAGLAMPRRVLLSPPQPLAAPLAAAERGSTSSSAGGSTGSSAAVAEALQRLRMVGRRHSGKVDGARVRLPAAGGGGDGYQRAYQRCRGPELDAPPLPQLKLQASWEGDKPAKDGNVTIVTSLHVDQLTLLEVHCAVWPHKIMAAVYAPLAPSGRVACPAAAQQQQSTLASLLGRLGLRSGSGCPYGDWPLEKLKRAVRATQQRAQQTGLCNLQLQLFTEAISEEMGPSAELLPQAALQNQALLALKPEAAEEHHAVVLLDGDMVSVDVWQLANWPTRWERAMAGMQAGKALVLPGFQLAPAGAEAALRDAAAAGSDVAVMQAAVDIVTAEAGKFPLMDLVAAGRAQPLNDHGFGGSQAAAQPALWFEAGDMHGMPDDGYPALPEAGFAPFVFMLQRHVPWADERLRGTYYQRAWQAVASRAGGLRHVVQPNAFALQLPHPEAYSRREASLGAFKQMEPVFQQLVAEVAAGSYVPVTSFAARCAQHVAPAAGAKKGSQSV